MARWATTGLALVLVLGACGSDDDTDASSSTTRAAGASDAENPSGSSDTTDETANTDTTDTSDETDATTAPPPTIPDVSSEEQPYVDAIAADEGSGLSPEESECLAAVIVQTMGVSAFEDAGVTPEDLAADVDAAMDEVGKALSDEAALDVADAVIETECVDYGALMSAAFLSGDATDEERSCMADGVIEIDAIRRFLADSVQGKDGDDPMSDAAVLNEIKAVAERCGIDSDTLGAELVPDGSRSEG